MHRRRLLILSSLLLCGVARAQDAPTLAVAWQSPDAAALTWAHLPAGACVARDERPILATCGMPDGARILPRTGGDAAERAVPGALYQAIVSPGRVVARARLALLPPAPEISATWQPGGAARVTWSGAPEGSCVYAYRPDGLVVRLEPCGAAQTVSLAAGGVDAAYAPRGGTVYVLRDERGQVELARVTLPRMTTALPIMAAP